MTLDRPPVSRSFPHNKLEAYRLALEMAKAARRLVKHFPRGNADLADHIVRAADHSVLLIAEGADRRGSGEKRQRFVEALGECGEVAASCDLVLASELAPETDTLNLQELAGRTAATMTGLIRRHS